MWVRVSIPLTSPLWTRELKRPDWGVWGVKRDGGVKATTSPLCNREPQQPDWGEKGEKRDRCVKDPTSPLWNWDRVDQTGERRERCGQWHQGSRAPNSGPRIEKPVLGEKGEKRIRVIEGLPPHSGTGDRSSQCGERRERGETRVTRPVLPSLWLLPACQRRSRSLGRRSRRHNFLRSPRLPRCLWRRWRLCQRLSLCLRQRR